MHIGVSIYEGRGVVMNGGSARVGRGRVEESGGKRGEIAGWSDESRRRLREYLIGWGAPEGWGTWGYTLTIPGRDQDEIEPGDVKECWRQFGQAMDRSGGSSVWRLELQTRGMAHYHGIMIAAGSLRWGAVDLLPADWLRIAWFSYIDRLLPYRGMWEASRRSDGRYLVQYMGGEFINADGVFRRSEIFGASDHAVHVEPEGGRSTWFRYLQDHASKRKQAQVAGDDWGRHWGIIGRRRFVRVVPTDAGMLTPVEYTRVRRGIRRASRLTIHDERSPFGTRLGYASKRGNFGGGAAVVFTSTGMVRRLVEWSKGESVENPRKWVNGARSFRPRRVDKVKAETVA